jgi:hypothetical protein
MRAAGTPVTSAAHSGVVADRLGRLLETLGVGLDEVVVDPVALDQDVQHGAEQRRVGAGPQAEEQVGRPGGGGNARVGDDELGAVVAGPPQVAGGDGRALGDVRADDEHDLGAGDVLPRVRGPVDAERLLVRSTGRDHAEPAVVVEVGRAQGEAGELADQVRLLVVEGDAREHGEGVVPVGLLDSADLRDGAVQGVVPGHRPEPLPVGRVPLHRLLQPVGMGVLQVALHALGAELPLVERELVPGLEADDLVALDLEDDPALLTAEAAVGLHLPVGLDAGLPTARGRAVEVGSVQVDESVLAQRWV